MIYQILLYFVSFVVNKFFRRITILGEPLRNEPVIFASNHPNMGLDPILIAVTAGRKLHFMAKSTLFSNFL